MRALSMPLSLRGEWKCDSNVKKITIPAYVTELTVRSFNGADSLEEIRFQPGSRLSRLKHWTFGGCKSLKSICIAASVDFIDSFCFGNSEDLDSKSAVEKVTFEKGSKLREIASFAFAGCHLLQSICLPASVEIIHGDSFATSGLRGVAIESGNPFFSMRGDFLMDSSGDCIVRYFGIGEEVTIPDEVSRLGSSCFSSCSRLRVVRFGSISQICSIPNYAFASCSCLQSILIPSSVTVLCSRCFAHCEALQFVSFCADSQLTEIGAYAFLSCERLKSIAVPPRVELLGKDCFNNCSKLKEVIFAADARLVRIEKRAFDGCASLQSIVLCQQVEFVGESCFSGCESLRTVTFSSTCSLRELFDLPRSWRGWLEIPDSVEILRVEQTCSRRHRHTLSFGPESRLEAIAVRRFKGARVCRCFERVSSQSLKIFRSRLEFESD
jgi:hypothetical protein